MATLWIVTEASDLHHKQPRIQCLRPLLDRPQYRKKTARSSKKSIMLIRLILANLERTQNPQKWTTNKFKIITRHKKAWTPGIWNKVKNRRVWQEHSSSWNSQSWMLMLIDSLTVRNRKNIVDKAYRTDGKEKHVRQTDRMTPKARSWIANSPVRNGIHA